ncbi:(2Fe-2S)-binding protein [bacterium]|nr:(2Fe-2S)-binding protein [bacterium]
MQAIINRKEIKIKKCDLDKQLLTFIREDLNLTGTKNGCNIGVCGACTVLINNEPQRSCKLKVSDIIDKELLTIEGMSENNDLHPLQKSFLDHDAVQCGFCTPGMVLTAHALLLKNNNPTEAEVRDAIKINLCRCTGYQQIVDSIISAKRFYK